MGVLGLLDELVADVGVDEDRDAATATAVGRRRCERQGANSPGRGWWSS